MRLGRLPSFPTTPATHDDSKHSDAPNEKTANKGAASGYPSLDGSVLIPTTQMGGAGADATKFLRGDRTWTVVDNHSRLHNHSAAADGNTLNPVNVDIQGYLELSGEIFPTLSADQNDWAPTDYDVYSVWIVTVTGADRTITGISNPGEGRVLLLINSEDSGFDMILAAHDTGSTAGNRFYIGADATADLTIPPGYGVVLRSTISDGWRMANPPPGAGGGLSAHDHTTGDGSGVLTNDEHDGYSEYYTIAEPDAAGAGKGRLYVALFGTSYRLFYKDQSSIVLGPIGEKATAVESGKGAAGFWSAPQSTTWTDGFDGLYLPSSSLGVSGTPSIVDDTAARRGRSVNFQSGAVTGNDGGWNTNNVIYPRYGPQYLFRFGIPEVANLRLFIGHLPATLATAVGSDDPGVRCLGLAYNWDNTAAYSPAVTLLNAINASVTTIDISSTGFPISAGDFIVIDSETIKVGSVDPSYSPVVTLNGDINNSTTTIVYTSAGDPIIGGDIIRIDNERILVGSVDTGTNTLSGCTRGYAGTSAASHLDTTEILHAGLFSCTRGYGGTTAASHSAAAAITERESTFRTHNKGAIGSFTRTDTGIHIEDDGGGVGGKDPFYVQILGGQITKITLFNAQFGKIYEKTFSLIAVPSVTDACRIVFGFETRTNAARNLRMFYSALRNVDG